MTVNFVLAIYDVPDINTEKVNQNPLHSLIAVFLRDILEVPPPFLYVVGSNAKKGLALLVLVFLA